MLLGGFELHATAVKSSRVDALQLRAAVVRDHAHERLELRRSPVLACLGLELRTLQVLVKSLTQGGLASALVALAWLLGPRTLQVALRRRNSCRMSNGSDSSGHDGRTTQWHD